MRRNADTCFIIGVTAILLALAPSAAADPLASWNDTDTRRAIESFIEQVTTEGSPGYVPPAERIAVFDNDGTLWAEQPIYFQAVFTFDRIRAMAPDHPEWREQEPFKSVLAGDLKAALAGGEESIADLMAATHAGMTTDEFARTVREWIATARHPQKDRRYIDMTYQPMLELLEHLRNNGFKTYIVSGGGSDFIRAWAKQAYGIPPEQVVGSRSKLRFEQRGDTFVLVKLPEMDHVDDEAGKPVGIHQIIGRRPILAFGNSDGDIQMLQWTTAGKPDSSGDHPRLGLILHHDDAEREWAYDRDSPIGRLDVALDEAPQRGWVVVSMQNDWNTVFPPD
jgi:phosphoglycolate phosphatase-like HAD superfamily hydrolase